MIKRTLPETIAVLQVVTKCIDVYGEFFSHHHVNHHQLVTNTVYIRSVFM